MAVMREPVNNNCICIYGQTDIGKNRTNNEDNLVFGPLWDDNHYLVVVIDGVGGYEGGEVAAEIAAKEIHSYLTTYRNGECRQLLCEAVNHANQCIVNERSLNEKFGSMSCVLSACIVDKKTQQIHIAHVGDTRIYCLFADGSMEKITHDHSLIGYREEIGDLTEEEAMRHPQRNIISRDVGSEEHGVDDPDWIESFTRSFQAGETLLLCSDGLCDMITKNQMADIIRNGQDTENRVNRLIDAANQCGGKDNVTVILVEFKVSGTNINIGSGTATQPDTNHEKVINFNPKQVKNKIVRKLTVAIVLLSLCVVGLLIILILSISRKNENSTYSPMPSNYKGKNILTLDTVSGNNEANDSINVYHLSFDNQNVQDNTNNQ